MCTEQTDRPALMMVVFYRPNAWWGWLIAYYQLLMGVKYWQVTHVELLTVSGMYAYRIDKTIIAATDEEIYEHDYCIALVDHMGDKERYVRAFNLRRTWGDFSPLSPFNGNHCVRWVNHLIGFKFTINLPGQLLEALELRDVQSTLRNKR